MTRLHEVFLRMQRYPDEFVGATKGKEFEERIMKALDTRAYTRILKEDISPDQFAQLKAVAKKGDPAVEARNPSTDFDKHFLYEPFGSQDYPDLLILDGHRAISVEVKFSKNRGQGHPMWNSGLPRLSGIYVFGNYGRQQVTFFRGCDVLSAEDIEHLRGFFEDQKSRESDFNARAMGRQPYGFTIYVRRAFDQKKTPNPEAITDFFKNPNRGRLEDAVIAHLRDG